MNDQDPRFLSFFLREPVYVVPEPAPLSASPPPVPNVPRWGHGQRDLLILVREPAHEFLAPPDQTFLEKILQAVSLSSDDVTLINTESLAKPLRRGFSTDEVLATVSYQTCLVFGEVPDQWPPNQYLEPYTVNEKDAKRWLLADALPRIANDTDKKARLWKCLQQLFRV